MKLGTMFSDIAQSIVRSPATEAYPAAGHDVPARARGMLRWDPAKCTGCSLCAKDCPAFALEVIVVDRKAKRVVMNYDVGKCAFCGQCVESCRFGCLSMEESLWELATADSSTFGQTMGSPDDIQAALAKSSR